MSGVLWLDWAITTVSLANTLLLFWLGLTVLLNAEHRTWGTWIAGSGLLLGGAFFSGHSAITGQALIFSSSALRFWWYFSWGPLILLPVVWYSLVLWYVGFWTPPRMHARRSQHFGLWLSLILISALSLLLFIEKPPVVYAANHLVFVFTRTIAGIPLLFPIYAAYIFLCTGLSLNALGSPGPSRRAMGELARQRAHPWLVAATAMLLLVCLLVAVAMLWLITRDDLVSLPQLRTLAAFDLSIASLIYAAIVLVGQAIVAYEIFTGKTLPRRGLFNYWRRAIILSIGYGAAISLSLTLKSPPIITLLLTTVLISVFYALLSWRSYAERDRYINHLRPFTTSPRMFDQLLAQPSDPPATIDILTTFEVLCQEIIGATIAFIVPHGPLSPFVGQPLVFPSGTELVLPPVNELIAHLVPHSKAFPLDPAQYHGAIWAVPLWRERGLTGVLFLGPKQDGGLYTQEEIEIAQNSSERLIDQKASAEIAQRLMALQRQRMAESQVIDQRTRRVLHDEVLQQLHTALIALARGNPAGGNEEAIALLTGAHRQISDLLHQMPVTSRPEIIQRGLTQSTRQLIDEEFSDIFDTVVWQIDDQVKRIEQSIPPVVVEVLYYAAREAIRNAARHGRSPDKDKHFQLKIMFEYRDGLNITIEDNGVGIVPSISDGQGLALHSTMMAVIGGELVLDSLPEQFTRVILFLAEDTLRDTYLQED